RRLHAGRRGGEACGRAWGAPPRCRRERQRAGVLQEARLRADAAQQRAARRRVARQHHDGEDPQHKGAPLMDKPDTPFPRHWLYYIVLKYAVLIAALVITVYTAYRLI